MKKNVRVIFEKYSKNSIFDPFWPLYAPNLNNGDLFQKSGSVTFLDFLSYNFMQKIAKIGPVVIEIF